MKERPILFSAPMVIAILDGRKTQTRRLVRLPAGVAADAIEGWRDDGHGSWYGYGQAATTGGLGVPATDFIPCPYGVASDRLWVRERVLRCTREERSQGSPVAVFAADGAPTVIDTWPWLRDHLPSIHMPRGVCRLVLEVTEVRVQRLQYIVEVDAQAEGVAADTSACDHTRLICAEIGCLGPGYRSAFAGLWDEINGDRASWASNPWVWAITFRRLP